jgi:hypothetical protein
MAVSNNVDLRGVFENSASIGDRPDLTVCLGDMFGIADDQAAAGIDIAGCLQRQPFGIAFAHTFGNLGDFVGFGTQHCQRLTPKFQRGVEGLAHLVVDAFLDQLQRMGAVPGTGKDCGIGKFVPRQLDDPGGGVFPVRGNHDGPRCLRPGCLQDIQSGAVAEPDLEAKGFGGADHFGIVVDDGDRAFPGQKRLAGHLPEPPEPDDQHRS